MEEQSRRQIYSSGIRPTLNATQDTFSVNRVQGAKIKRNALLMVCPLCAAVCCRVFQCVAVLCNVLRYVVVCCSVIYVTVVPSNVERLNFSNIAKLCGVWSDCVLISLFPSLLLVLSCMSVRAHFLSLCFALFIFLCSQARFPRRGNASPALRIPTRHQKALHRLIAFATPGIQGQMGARARNASREHTSQTQDLLHAPTV